MKFCKGMGIVVYLLSGMCCLINAMEKEVALKSWACQDIYAAFKDNNEKKVLEFLKEDEESRLCRGDKFCIFHKRPWIAYAMHRRYMQVVDYYIKKDKGALDERYVFDFLVGTYMCRDTHKNEVKEVGSFIQKSYEREKFASLCNNVKSYIALINPSEKCDNFNKNLLADIKYPLWVLVKSETSSHGYFKTFAEYVFSGQRTDIILSLIQYRAHNCFSFFSEHKKDYDTSFITKAVEYWLSIYFWELVLSQSENTEMKLDMSYEEIEKIVEKDTVIKPTIDALEEYFSIDYSLKNITKSPLIVLDYICSDMDKVVIWVNFLKNYPLFYKLVAEEASMSLKFVKELADDKGADISIKSKYEALKKLCDLKKLFDLLEIQRALN